MLVAELGNDRGAPVERGLGDGTESPTSLTAPAQKPLPEKGPEQYSAGQLIGPNGQLQLKAQELLQSLGLSPHEHPYRALKEMSHSWYKPEGGIRDEVRQTYSRIAPPERLAFYRDLGFVDSIRSSVQHADLVLVMGGIQEWVQNRFHALEQAWNQGVSFDKIVMLGSDRPLNPNHEDMAKTLENSSWTGIPAYGSDQQADVDLFGSHEIGMMRALMDNEASLLRAWKDSNVDILWDLTKKAAGVEKYPNTADTVRHYLQENRGAKLPQDVIVVSSQPFVGYQETTTRLTFLQETGNLPRIHGIGGERVQPTSEYGYMNIFLLRLREEYRLNQHLTR